MPPQQEGPAPGRGDTRAGGTGGLPPSPSWTEWVMQHAGLCTHQCFPGVLAPSPSSTPQPLPPAGRLGNNCRGVGGGWAWLGARTANMVAICATTRQSCVPHQALHSPHQAPERRSGHPGVQRHLTEVPESGMLLLHASQSHASRLNLTSSSMTTGNSHLSAPAAQSTQQVHAHLTRAQTYTHCQVGLPPSFPTGAPLTPKPPGSLLSC